MLDANDGVDKAYEAMHWRCDDCEDTGTRFDGSQCDCESAHRYDPRRDLDMSQRQAIPVIADFLMPTDQFAQIRSAVEAQVQTPEYRQYLSERDAFFALLDARYRFAVGRLVIDHYDCEHARDWSYAWVIGKSDASISEKDWATYVLVQGRVIAALRKER